jgi:hypothetical protein
MLAKGLTLFLLLGALSLQGQTDSLPAFPGAPADSLAPAGDSASTQPAVAVNLDSLKAASDLKAPVKYKAEDSIVFDVKSGRLLLFDKSNIQYEDITLDAARVELEVENQVLHAFGDTDSSGKKSGLPVFSQEGKSYNAETLSYNFKSKKGRITGGRMAEGEGIILAGTAKYLPDGSFNGLDGRYTTCNAEHPHYYIKSKKLKLLPGNQLISGPLRLVIADVPLPFIIPFGFVPNQTGKTSGILMPQYGDAQARGFFLQGLGYYFNINDYLDLELNADIYTRGGWRLGMRTTYTKKYAFNGNFSFDYGVVRFNEPTDPDFQRTSEWSLRWNHNQPINPTARFSSAVNISSSSRYQREVSFNQSDFFTNNLNSSINFQKNFNNLPFSFNMSARHQQDLNKNTVSMQLPEFSFNMNRLTPFKSVNGKAFDWLRQLGVSYNSQASNRIDNIADSLFLPVLLRPSDSILIAEFVGGDTLFTLRPASSLYTNGMQHVIRTSTQLKLLKVINIGPSFNYDEYWYLSTTRKSWDAEARKVVESEAQGFQRGYNFNFSVGASANLFGIYQLTRSKREITFRQRFTPTVSYGYRPDFSEDRWGFYREVQVDTTGRTQRYSIFEDGIYRGPQPGESQSLSFSVNSNVEMKYRKKESYEPDFDPKQDKFARTVIIDNLGLNTSYNFAADSFRLSPISLTARTSLFNRKLSINSGATLDPYMFAPVEGPGGELLPARRLDRYLLLEQGIPGRITRVFVNMNTSFEPKRKKSALPPQQAPGFDQEEYAHALSHPYQYVDFSIPWSLRLDYTLNYVRNGVEKPAIVQTVNADADLTFATHWKIGVTSGFDLTALQATATRIAIARELHCWQMSFQWVPFGPQKSYSFAINARSATLSMLRLTKNDFWQNRFRTL